MAPSVASHPGGAQTLPVLDYTLLQTCSAAGLKAFAYELRKACTEVGFFYLDISGCDAGGSAASQALAAARGFFSLPLAEKQKIDIKNSPHFRGYAQVGRETTAHKTDLREQVDFGLEATALPGGSTEVRDAPYLRVLVGPNQWPDERRLPTFRPQLEGWFTAMGEIGDRLVEAFAVAMGLSPMYFASCGYFTPRRHGDSKVGDSGADAGRHCRMKISRYPPISETGAEGKAAFNAGSLGVGPHKVSANAVTHSVLSRSRGGQRLTSMFHAVCCTVCQDGGFLSLLLQDRWGLQVQVDDGTDSVGFLVFDALVVVDPIQKLSETYSNGKLGNSDKISRCIQVVGLMHHPCR